jgi:hypothetical protein
MRASCFIELLVGSFDQVSSVWLDGVISGVELLIRSVTVLKLLWEKFGARAPSLVEWFSGPIFFI